MVCAAKGMLAPHAAATPHSRRIARDASTKRGRRLQFLTLPRGSAEATQHQPAPPLAARERGGDAAPAGSSPGRAGAPRRRSASRLLPWPRGSAEATQRQPAPPLAARERGWGRWRAPTARDGGGMCSRLDRFRVRSDRRLTARADALRLAASAIALPVAALPRGATPPIRADARTGGEPDGPGHPRWCADGRGVGQAARHSARTSGSGSVGSRSARRA